MGKIRFLLIASIVPEIKKIFPEAKIFAAPTYRTLSCPEKFLDCRAVPGEGHPWTQLS